MLESALKEQLKGIFAGLEANFTFDRFFVKFGGTSSIVNK